MPITIPNRVLVKPTTTPFRKPAQAKTGVVNPCPVRIAPSGTTGTGGPLCEPTVIRAGYYGFNVRPDVPAGGSADDEAYAVVSGCIVDGFAGCVQGSEVFVDTTARPDPESTFSGLTHTAPGAGSVVPIGVAVSATKIYFYQM